MAPDTTDKKNPLFGRKEGSFVQRICLGKIAQAHGIEGMVKVSVYAENPKSLETYSPLFTSEAGDQTLKIRMKGAVGRHYLARIDGVTDRNAAEALKGITLWVDRSRLPAPDENEFYIVDLVGLQALDENGQAIGQVMAVENYGAGDLLDIKPASGSNFLMPFADEYIVRLSLEERIIVLKGYEDFR